MIKIKTDLGQGLGQTIRRLRIWQLNRHIAHCERLIDTLESPSAVQLSLAFLASSTRKRDSLTASLQEELRS